MSELKPSNSKVLASGGLLAKNSVLNLLGQGVPLLAAVIAIPILIRGLGVDRFGVLTIVWMVIGYFSLFDLGLGRALTQLVSKKLGTGEVEDIPTLVWTSLVLMFALGIIGALVLGITSIWLVNSVLKIPDQLKSETQSAFILISVGVPIVIVTAGFAGVLSALQRFDVLNKIRIPMGLYSFIAPLLILPFTQSLYPITAALVTGRLLACSMHLVACLNVMPTLRTGFDFQFSAVKPLFRFGAWMTVTNVVGPLMVYLDRFAIGGIVSVASVAYYATPYELVTKLWIIPGAVVGVLFPAFAECYSRNPDRALLLFIRGTKYVAIMMFPIVLLVTAFAHEGLQLWLGYEFANNSDRVLQWLAIGVYINSLALIFITYIQAIGRPDISAKLHFIELPFYLLLLWWAIHSYGIGGAAIVWVVRVSADGIVLFILSTHHLGGYSKRLTQLSSSVVIAVLCLCLPFFLISFFERVIYSLVISCLYIYMVWFWVLATDERIRIKFYISRFTKKKEI